MKADVLRELASSSQDDDLYTGTQYSGNTFLGRDTNTMTGAHSSGTALARADAKIKLSNKYTSQSGDSPPELTSGQSLKDSNSMHQP